jgi:hypothetical protein
MTSSKQQKKDKTAGNVEEEGKKYNCQCGDSFSSVEELNDHNHKAH